MKNNKNGWQFEFDPLWAVSGFCWLFPNFWWLSWQLTYISKIGWVLHMFCWLESSFWRAWILTKFGFFMLSQSGHQHIFTFDQKGGYTPTLSFVDVLFEQVLYEELFNHTINLSGFYSMNFLKVPSPLCWKCEFKYAYNLLNVFLVFNISDLR